MTVDRQHMALECYQIKFDGRQMTLEVIILFAFGVLISQKLNPLRRSAGHNDFSECGIDGGSAPS
jgi:hypothetical protein